VPCACLHVKHVLWEWGLNSLAESADPQPPQTKATNDDGASDGTDGVLLVAALSTRWNWYLTEEPRARSSGVSWSSAIQARRPSLRDHLMS
jgi:hypothetical protein